MDLNAALLRLIAKQEAEIERLQAETAERARALDAVLVDAAQLRARLAASQEEAPHASS